MAEPDRAAQFHGGVDGSKAGVIMEQKFMRVALTLVMAALPLVGCAAHDFGQRSNFVATSVPAIRPVENYTIGPLDILTITVFQVPDLTLKSAQVDASGRIALPLIGSVTASGKTTSELSAEIASKLEAGFLQSPQVSVIVEDAVGQKVTVDGAVIEPGVFQLKGRTTLLQAVAMAKGPGRNAELRRVAVFRMQDGHRTVAVFNLDGIRNGTEDDPEIFGGDVIVVDGSALKSAFREILSALPALAIFRPY